MEDKEQSIAQVLQAFGITMRLAPESGQVAAQTVVHAFDDVRVRLAPDVLRVGEDGAVGGVLVGGVSDCSAVRNLRTQCSGCWGVAIAQDPAENSLGKGINSPPEPNSAFFSPM
jgi:hypothetical protein